MPPYSSWKPLLFLFIFVSIVTFLLFGLTDNVSIVFEGPSAISESNLVVVEISPNVRQLRFGRDGVRQSEVKLNDVEYLELAYTRGLVAGLVFLERVPKRILFFGLGGGSLPRYLRKHYPDAVIEVVEFDANVLHTAEAYFGFKQDQNLHVTIKDGRQVLDECHNAVTAGAQSHIAACKERPDLIIQDACCGAPCDLVTPSAFRKVAEMLAPGGVFLQNIYLLQQDVVRNIQDAFPQSYLMVTPPNMIAIGTQSSARILHEDLRDRAKLFQLFEKPSFDVVRLLERDTLYITQSHIAHAPYAPGQ